MSRFVANKNAKGEVVNNSFVLRGYVRHWLGQVWGEFDRVKLLDLDSHRGWKGTSARSRASAFLSEPKARSASGVLMSFRNSVTSAERMSAWVISGQTIAHRKPPSSAYDAADIPSA